MRSDPTAFSARGDDNRATGSGVLPSRLRRAHSPRLPARPVVRLVPKERPGRPGQVQRAHVELYIRGPGDRPLMDSSVVATMQTWRNRISSNRSRSWVRVSSRWTLGSRAYTAGSAGMSPSMWANRKYPRMAELTEPEDVRPGYLVAGPCRRRALGRLPGAGPQPEAW